jgi:hypothetical protein
MSTITKTLFASIRDKRVLQKESLTFLTCASSFASDRLTGLSSFTVNRGGDHFYSYNWRSWAASSRP